MNRDYRKSKYHETKLNFGAVSTAGFEDKAATISIRKTEIARLTVILFA